MKTTVTFYIKAWIVLVLGIFSLPYAVADNLFKNTTFAVYPISGASNNHKLIRLLTNNNAANLHLTADYVNSLGIKNVILEIKYKQYGATLRSNDYYSSRNNYGWVFPEWQSSDPGNSIISVTADTQQDPGASTIIYGTKGLPEVIWLDSRFYMKIKDGEEFVPSFLRIKAIYETEGGKFEDMFVQSDCGEPRADCAAGLQMKSPDREKR